MRSIEIVRRLKFWNWSTQNVSRIMHLTAIECLLQLCLNFLFNIFGIISTFIAHLLFLIYVHVFLVLFSLSWLICLVLAPSVFHNQNSLFSLKRFYSECLKYSFFRWSIFVFFWNFSLSQLLRCFYTMFWHVACYDTLHSFTSKYIFRAFLCRKLFFKPASKSMLKIPEKSCR